MRDLSWHGLQVLIVTSRVPESFCVSPSTVLFFMDLTQQELSHAKFIGLGSRGACTGNACSIDSLYNQAILNNGVRLYISLAMGV